MYQPGGNTEEIFREMTRNGPYQVLRQTYCTESRIGFTHQDQTSKLPNLPSDRCGWTTVKESPTAKESTDKVVSEDTVVWVHASEFKKKQSQFELEDSPIDHTLPAPSLQEIDDCKANLIGLLRAIYQEDIASWLDTFTIGKRLICSLESETLQTAECQDEECEVAILFVLMMQAEQSGISALWSAMAKFGWKLSSVCSLKIQLLISSISKVLSEKSNTTEFQEFLRRRYKTAQTTITMTDQSLQDESNEKLERMKSSLISLLKFDAKVRMAFGILHADARHVVNAWDNFTLQERLQAGSVACNIMKAICVLPDHKDWMTSINQLWQIMKAENQNAGRLDVVCISVYKLRSEQWGGSHDIFVVEWLASPFDLCSKITKDYILQYLEMSKIDADESNLVLLPVCNAYDYNDLKKKQFDDINTRLFKNKIIKKFLRAQSLFQKVQVSNKTEDAGIKAFLVFTELTPRGSRFIQLERVSTKPKFGICLGKNINLIQACRVFNEPALDIQPGFERANHLYPAEQLAGLLSEQATGMGRPLFADMLQSSFDSFGWFSNVSNDRVGVWKSRCDRLSPRMALTTINSSNAERVLKNVVSNWGRKTVVAGASSCVQSRDAGVTRVLKNPDYDLNTDDQLLNGEEESAISSYAPESGALDFGRVKDLPRRIPDAHDTIVKCLRDNSFVRYIQVDFDTENRTHVNSITFMVILPDTETSKETNEIQVSQNPVSMHVAYRPTKGGRFVNCSCSSFANKIRNIQLNEHDSFETYEPWFFNSSKCCLLHEQRAKKYCMHIDVEIAEIQELFNQGIYKWNEQESKMNVEKKNIPSWQTFKHSSIALTTQDGLTSLGDALFQENAIVPLNRNSAWLSQSREGKAIYSVDCCGEKRHAFVRVFLRRFVNDVSHERRRHEQISCDQCDSKFYSNGYAPCKHIMAVYRALHAFADDEMDGEDLAQHDSAAKQPRTQSGYYDPKRANTKCNLGYVRTGYVFLGTYTDVQHQMDVVWRNKLCFGDEISRPKANAKNKILDHKTAITGQHYSYFAVDEGEILSTELPLQCPKCGLGCDTKTVKTMKVVLHMSDQKLVQTPVKYWVCACRFCVHTDGFADGFWFINLHLAVSTQCMWDLLDHQMTNSGMDFATFCKACNSQAMNVNRDVRNRFITRNLLSDVYFAFFSRLSIGFNQACYGCMSDAIGFPTSRKYSDIQKWSEDAPPEVQSSARDIAHVGMDGLSSFFAKEIDFEKNAELTKKSRTDRTPAKPKSQSKPIPLQNDRCPIRTGGPDSRGYVFAAAASKAVRQCAMRLRKGFIALGNLIMGTTAKKDWYCSLSNSIEDQVTAIAVLIKEGSNQLSLLQPLTLAKVCSDPVALCNEFGIEKAKRLMTFGGKLLREIGANNSVVGLLKLNAIDQCFKFCNLAMSAGSDRARVIHEHELLRTVFKSNIAILSPAAQSLCVLLEYFCLDADGRTSTIQMQVNTALCQSLLFVAERAQEVFKLYGFDEGYRPHPVRAPQDHWRTWPNDVLMIKESPEPGNPVTDHGAYYFTKNGAKLRDYPEDDSRFDKPEHDNDCKKPGYQRDRRAGRAAGKRMIFCVFCVLHGIFMGYHIIFGSEGRKDPFYAMFVFKPTAPYSTSYDFSCG